MIRAHLLQHLGQGDRPVGRGVATEHPVGHHLAVDEPWIFHLVGEQLVALRVDAVRRDLDLDHCLLLKTFSSTAASVWWMRAYSIFGSPCVASSLSTAYW